MNSKTDKEGRSYDDIAFLSEIIVNFRFWQEIKTPRISQIWGKFRAYHQFTEVQCICNLYNCRNLFTPKHFNLNLI